jgi:hypothetical protein
MVRTPSGLSRFPYPAAERKRGGKRAGTGAAPKAQARTRSKRHPPKGL